MGAPFKQPGELWKSYTTAEATEIGKGRRVAGMVYPGIITVFKLLQNSSATTITATAAKGMAVRATSIPNLQVQPASTLGALNFGGVRTPSIRNGALVAPEDIAQNNWGYFAIAGYAIGMLGLAAPALVAGAYVMLDDDADPGRVGGVNVATLAEVAGAFAFAHAASGGVEDEAAPMTIFKNAWGEYQAD
jgi:hypothetical protein